MRKEKKKLPVYSFRCKRCTTIYEELADWDETKKFKGVKCPSCKSSRKELSYTECNVEMIPDKPRDSGKWDKFSYRAGHLMEKAQGERRQAAAKSHMGSDPYNYKRLKD